MRIANISYYEMFRGKIIQLSDSASNKHNEIEESGDKLGQSHINSWLLKHLHLTSEVCPLFLLNDFLIPFMGKETLYSVLCVYGWLSATGVRP